MRKLKFANPKLKTHRPPHIFEDNAVYFITGRTYFGFPHLKDNKIKRYFLEKLHQSKSKYKFELQGWVVLDNHYHLLVKFGVAQFIARFIKELHGSTSHFIRRINSASPEKTGIAQFTARQLLELKPPPVWYQYLETIIRSEADFYRHLNYIHQNPVKHGYTQEMGKYQFSSYQYYLKEKGKEWLTDCFREYPILDFEPKGGAD